ncbi:MAG TPA: hypothetical protein VHT94_06050 [Streptosporangiaceae bacterium]|nr:hypothetical protein [Streptosporangiaceae bacterium]
MTVNGRPLSPSRNLPRFSVRAGQLVMISVRVRVPRRASVSALSLGISAGTIGGVPQHPAGVDPVLLYSHQVLRAGSHSFSLRWRVPAKTSPGKHMYLVANWASRQPAAFQVAQFIAHLALT